MTNGKARASYYIGTGSKYFIYCHGDGCCWLECCARSPRGCRVATSGGSIMSIEHRKKLCGNKKQNAFYTMFILCNKNTSLALTIRFYWLKFLDLHGKWAWQLKFDILLICVWLTGIFLSSFRFIALRLAEILLFIQTQKTKTSLFSAAKKFTQLRKLLNALWLSFKAINDISDSCDRYRMQSKDSTCGWQLRPRPPTHTHTHTIFGISVYIISICLCICSCFLAKLKLTFRLWLLR